MKRYSKKNDVCDFILSSKQKNGKILSQLLQSFACKKQVSFEELTPEFLSGFKCFLESQNYKPSTVFFYLSFLRIYCNKALKVGISNYYPFKDYHLVKEKEPEKPYYTTYQLEKLRSVEHLIKPLVRNAFYFVLYTGITTTQLRTLTIVQTRKMKLSAYARKLSETIINGRINEDELLFKGLPEKSRLSSTLRLWGALANLTQRPTLLCARNTFVMNEIRKGKTIQQIAKNLGLKRCKGFTVHKQLFEALSDKTSV